MNQIKILFPYTVSTLLLALFLGTPYLLKIYDADLEIYPAIILPAGAGKADLTVNTYTYNKTVFFGKTDSDDEWKEIDLSTIMHPISPYHIYYGVQKNLSSRLLVNAEKTNGIGWLKKRLRENNFRSDVIMMTEMKIEAEITSHFMTRKEVLSNEIFNLD